MCNQNGGTTHDECDRKLTEQPPASIEEYGFEADVIEDEDFAEWLENLSRKQTRCTNDYEQTRRVTRIHSRGVPCQRGTRQQAKNPMVSELHAERKVMRASEMPAEMHTHGNREGPA